MMKGKRHLHLVNDLKLEANDEQPSSVLLNPFPPFNFYTSLKYMNKFQSIESFDYRALV